MSTKILLADDSITIQKVVSLTLRDTEYELISVNNGDDAVKRAREEKPDIIIADVSMPGKTGYEVCREIKSDPELQSVPVILMHGTFETFNEDLAKEVGADDYLTKPFESSTFLQMIQKHLKGEAPSRGEPPQEGAKEEGILLEEEVEELEEPSLIEGEPEVAEVEPAEGLSDELTGEQPYEGEASAEEFDIEGEESVLEAEPLEGEEVEEAELLEASLEEGEALEGEFLETEMVETAEEPEVMGEEAEEPVAGDEWTEPEYEFEAETEEELEAEALEEPESEEELLLEEEVEEEKAGEEPGVEMPYERGEAFSAGEELFETQGEEFGEDIVGEETVLEEEGVSLEEASFQESEPFDEVISTYESEAPAEAKEEEITQISLEEEETETALLETHQETQGEAPTEKAVFQPHEGEVREIIKEVAEKVVWEVVPDLVEMVVKRELEKRLKK